VAAAQVMRGKIEERILLQQRVFKPRGLDGRDFHIWSDATAAEHGAPAIRKPDFLIGAALLLITIVIIIVERDSGVIALDQAAARGVVLGGGQGQPGIFRKRINGLDQAFAECGFSGNQATIMVLNGAGNNLRSRSRATIYKDNQRIILATIAVSSAINFFRRTAAVVGNNHLSFFQEFISYADALIQQSARITTEIEDQPFHIAELLQGVFNFALSGFIEGGDVHVANAGANFEFQINAVTRNLITDHSEFERLFRAFAQDADVNRSALGTF